MKLERSFQTAQVVLGGTAVHHSLPRERVSALGQLFISTWVFCSGPSLPWRCVCHPPFSGAAQAVRETTGTLRQPLCCAGSCLSCGSTLATEDACTLSKSSAEVGCALLQMQTCMRLLAQAHVRRAADVCRAPPAAGSVSAPAYVSSLRRPHDGRDEGGVTMDPLHRRGS